MSKIICHEHCPRGGHGGPGLGLVLAIVALVACGAAARTAAPALESAGRTALHVLEIVAIVLAAGAGLAGAGWIAHRTLRVRHEEAETAAAVHQHSGLPASAAQMLTAARAVLAIEAPKPYQRETSGVADVVAPAHMIKEEK